MPKTSLLTLLERRDAFLRFVERRVANPALAEDILQAAYMRALEPGRALPDEESVVTWFYSVLRHAVIDSYRRRAVESSAMERWTKEWNADPNFAEPAMVPPDDRTFVCGCIERVLPNLRPAYAEAIREVDLGEMELAAFAEKHALSRGNAAVRVHRARTALRTSLASFCGACSTHACLDCDCKHPAVDAAS